jgi:hypothetical protein
LAYGSLLNEISYNDIIVDEDYAVHKQKFMNKTQSFLGINKYLYTGTFFWLNGLTISEYLRKNSIPIPPFTDRWYGENFCANLFPMEFAYTHNGRYSKNYLQDGVEIEMLIRHSMTEEEFYIFSDFYNNIMSKV